LVGAGRRLLDACPGLVPGVMTVRARATATSPADVKAVAGHPIASTAAAP